MSAVNTVNDVFQALFYGEGSWFGLLLIWSIMLPMVMKWREACVLFLAAGIFMMIGYIDNGLGWHALIFGLGSFFILYVAATKKGKR